MRTHTHPCCFQRHPEIRCTNVIRCTGLPTYDDAGVWCTAITPDEEATARCEDCADLTVCQECGAWLDEHQHRDECSYWSEVADELEADAAYEIERDRR